MERNFSLPRSHGQQLRLKLQTGPALRQAAGAGAGARALRYLRAGAQGAALPCPKTDGPVPMGLAANLRELSNIRKAISIIINFLPAFNFQYQTY